MKKYLYSGATLLCALLSLALAVLFVITLLPVGIEGVRVDEEIRVSSSAIDADGGEYLLQVRGSLINETDEPVVLDAITLHLSDGEHKHTFTLDGVTLEPRFPLDLTDSWEDAVAYTYVDAVYVTLDGAEHRLENSAETVIGIDSVVTLAAALVLALAAVGFGKQRYYMYQEEKMK